MRLLATCLMLGSVSSVAIAQDQPNTILVLDGSGSMWGQIDGVAKITIAQEVVNGLLADFPADQGLGLTVYGHRERGNCTDIETIVAPAPGTAGQIASAVNAIKPLGKTPMTDAVIAAAEALRYTEDSATVILVSDGVETCNPDPCAAARLLEEAGINFTTHVVGFDVSDPEALAQMQCIADETGGQFLTAANADELDLAMAAIVMEPAPEPVPEPEPALVEMTFTAVIGDDETLIDTPILWDIDGNDGTIVASVQGNPYIHALPEGAYTARAYSVAAEETGSAQFIAIAGGTAAVTVTFTETLPTARIIAPASAAAGDSVQVGWNGPALEGDYIGIGAVDAEANERWQNFIYVGDGNPNDLLMPTTPGDYLIQYFLGGSRDIIGQTPISLTPVTATIATPAQATAGGQISVDWTGPDYAGDYIGIGAVGATGNARWSNFFYTGDGASPSELTVPTEPGEYEISYFHGQDRSILQTTQVTVSATGATLTAPAEAMAGSTISVDWTGPDYDGDYIGIGAVDATGNSRWNSFHYTENGSPAILTVPTAPGDYLVQYFVGQDRSTLAAAPVTATQVTATVTAPEQAVAGSTISVDWTGPDYDGDYIGIGQVDASGTARWQSFHYTEDGSPASLLVPIEAGQYLVQYFLRQDRSILATQTVEVTALKVAITAPQTAVAGSTIEIGYDGPNYAGDYIGIGAVGASGTGRWETFTYTEAGSPLSILVPINPGAYEIAYFSGQDRTILAKAPMQVAGFDAQLVAPATAQAGSDVIIGWDGPDYDGDYIGIGIEGAEGSARWRSFAYTERGNPVTITLPDAAGDYVIQYFTGQGRVSVATQALSVE